MQTLADAIIEERIDQVANHLQFGAHVNQLDEYGFTPLIEAAIANNTEIARLLIDHGADVNLKDATGGTALTWAAENNNLTLSQLLLERGADPNAYTFAGQAVLVMPLLRQQKKLKDLLLQHGANLQFAQDYINTKLLGHLFELVGTATIMSPANQLVEVDFEGFYLEFSIGLIGESLDQFKNHFSARQLRRYAQIIQMIIEVFARSSQLIKYQQYQINVNKHTQEIANLLGSEPLLIPVGYEGHAITFLKFGNVFVKCDRREDSRLYDNIVFYQVEHPERLTADFIKNVLYEQQSSEFINEKLPVFLGLKPVTELKVTAQISGNCSWANVEACIPSLFFLLCSHQEDFHKNMSSYKNLALSLFQQWRDWNRDRALHFCMESFADASALRKACKAEIIAAILFQCGPSENFASSDRIEEMIKMLTTPGYEYILKNYIQSYAYQATGVEGQNFLSLLKRYGYSAR